MTQEGTKVAAPWCLFRESTVQELKEIIANSNTHTISSVAREMNINRTTLQHNFDNDCGMPDDRIPVVCVAVGENPVSFLSSEFRINHATWVILTRTYEQVSEFVKKLDLDDETEDRLLQALALFYKGDTDIDQ